MNIKLVLRHVGTGEVSGWYRSTNDLIREYEAWTSGEAWPFEVVDGHGQVYPFFFDLVPRFSMKHIYGGVLVGGWWPSKRECLYRFKISADYRQAIIDYVVMEDHGPMRDMVEERKWKVVDQKNREWKEDREYNWEYYIPVDASEGKFALINTAAGVTFAWKKTVGKYPAWMKLRGLWVFAATRAFSKKHTKVVENLGEGKWRFREDMDPWG